MKIAAALTICCILALGSFQEGAAQEPTKAFRVHYIGGPADFTGEHLELTVTPQALLMEGKAGKQRKSVSISWMASSLWCTARCGSAALTKWVPTCRMSVSIRGKVRVGVLERVTS
jgi:hypothetical protein